MARSTVNGLKQGLHGDETTTGAICYSSLPFIKQDNRGVLRVGDKTSNCPRCGQQGTIAEGWKGLKWNGAPTALHGAAVQCGCPAGSNRLIAQDPPAHSAHMGNSATAATNARQAPPASRNPATSPYAPAAPFSTEQDNEPAEPGFYIVPKSIPRQQLVSELFGARPSPEVMRKFNGLNGSLGDDIVKAGQMVVLADPRNYMCMREEAHLMKEAEEVAVALADLEPDDADFMIKYRGEIAVLLGEVSLWAGVSAAVIENHLRDIKDELNKLVALHQDTYRKYGKLQVPEFFEKRKKILDELDAKFFRSTRVRSFASLGNHPKLQKALHISTKSLVHHWKKAGGPGDIPGYSRYAKSISKAAGYMHTGGLLAIGVGGVSSALTIWETCTTGNEAACKRVAMTEAPKFLVSSGAGYAAGNFASKHSLKICAGRSKSPTGLMVCVATVVGGASFAGAAMGAMAGEFAGESVHDHFLRD